MRSAVVRESLCDRNRVRRKREVEERVRIHTSAVEFYSPVQMRAGRPAACPDFADDLSCFHKIAVLDEHLRQMKIHAVEAQSMIDEDSLAREHMINCEPHHAVIGGGHVRPQRGPDVFAVVRISRLTVHDPDAAEDAGTLSAHWFDETAMP